MVDWKSKYLEMKLKYINAKYKLTGGDFAIQTGGAHAFSRGAPFYIMYPLTLENPHHEQIIRAVSERRSILLRDNIRYDNPDEVLQLHITLFNFFVNLQHSQKDKVDWFQKPHFRNHIKRAFNQYLENITLTADPVGEYKILGTNFWGKAFTINDPNAITNFRSEIYKYINTHLGRWSNGNGEARNGYTYFAIDGEDLIAVADFHRGRGNWLPHISILELTNPVYTTLSLKDRNNDLYNEFPQVVRVILEDPTAENQDKIDILNANKVDINNTLDTDIEINMNDRLEELVPDECLQRYGYAQVMPFCDINLVNNSNDEPLHISMHRTLPHLNWSV